MTSHLIQLNFLHNSLSRAVASCPPICLVNYQVLKTKKIVFMGSEMNNNIRISETDLLYFLSTLFK